MAVDTVFPKEFIRPDVMTSDPAVLWRDIEGFKTPTASTSTLALPSEAAAAEPYRPSLGSGYGWFERSPHKLWCLRPYGTATAGDATASVFGISIKIDERNGTIYWSYDELFQLSITLNTTAGAVPNEASGYVYASSISATNYALTSSSPQVIGNAKKRVLFDAMGYPRIGVQLRCGTATAMGCEYGAAL